MLFVYDSHEWWYPWEAADQPPADFRFVGVTPSSAAKLRSRSLFATDRRRRDPFTSAYFQSAEMEF